MIGADRRRSEPSCVLPKGVPQGQTESGGIVLAAICWAPSAQRCHPKEALYLPIFSHLLIVNRLLSLSLSLSLYRDRLYKKGHVRRAYYTRAALPRGSRAYVFLLTVAPSVPSFQVHCV